MIQAQYHQWLLLEQLRLQRIVMDRIVAARVQQAAMSHAPLLLSYEALVSSVNEATLDRPFFANGLLGSQNQNAFAIPEPLTDASTLLARPDDSSFLSKYQAFLRQNIELFQATQEVVSTPMRGRNTPIYLGQVGIRCCHCKHIPLLSRQKGSIYFPSNTMRIYQASQNMANTHMINGACKEMPQSAKEQFHSLLTTKSIGGGVGRAYWSQTAKDLGLVDTSEGIRFRSNVPTRLEILDDVL